MIQESVFGIALLKKINDFCADLKTAFEDNARIPGRKAVFKDAKKRDFNE